MECSKGFIVSVQSENIYYKPSCRSQTNRHLPQGNPNSYMCLVKYIYSVYVYTHTHIHICFRLH